jgi:hypothetical protein
MLYPIVRLLVAAAALAAVFAQFERSLSLALVSPTPFGSHIPTMVTNFFSFFTIQSNLATAVVLAIAAIWALRRRYDTAREPWGIALALTCVTTYMVVTGIVYNTLLRGIEQAPGAVVGWSNEILHVWVPVFLLVDALIGYRRRALPWRAALIVAIYPIAWALYTLVRAPYITNPGTGVPYWYPYPFLDPNVVAGGYLGVAGYVVGIAVAIVTVAFGVVAIGRWRGARVAASPAAPGARSPR